MTISLQRFFRLITEMNVGEKSLTGMVLPKTQEDINYLLDWSETSREFRLESTDVLIDQKVSFTLRPMLQDGLGYASYHQYFDKKREWWKSPSFDKVVEHQWWEYQVSIGNDVQDQQIPCNKLQVIVDLFKLLTDTEKFYVTNDIVVFFSKKPTELIIKARDSQQFVKLIQNLSDSQIHAINDICKLLGENTNDEHFYSKKNAFSTAVIDYLTEKYGKIQHDICDLLVDIINIKNQTFVQYDLYLEDFSYSKFVKKIEESSTKFIARINETLNRSVTQVLALPVATVVLKFMDNVDLSLIAYISLFIYCLICAFVLCNQSKIIQHIKEEVKLFENTLPRELHNQLWELNSKTIAEQIKSQKRLSYLLWCTIIGCMILLIFKVFINYHLLIVVCGSS